MSDTERPPIPSALKREIRMEAGFRRAIPTCRHPTIDIAHIIPYEQVREHRSENLIVLCPTRHTRYDRGEIDRKSMQIYKANLSIITSRYGDLEQRVLKDFADNPQKVSISILNGLEILLKNLIQDGLIIKTKPANVFMINRPDYLNDDYAITEKGRAFISRWLNAKEME